MNYYEVLNISQDATDEDIKKAFEDIEKRTDNELESQETRPTTKKRKHENTDTMSTYNSQLFGQQKQTSQEHDNTHSSLNAKIQKTESNNNNASLKKETPFQFT